MFIFLERGADYLHMVHLTPSSLALLKSKTVHLSHATLLRLSWKEPIKREQ